MVNLPRQPMGAYPRVRMRRNRRDDWSRRLVAEHRLSAADFIWPVFIHDERAARAPIESMPGVGKVTEKRLHDFGILKIGQLANLDDIFLREHFGEWGLALAAKARGEDAGGWYDAEVGDDAGPKSISHEHTFSEDTSDKVTLEATLLRLSEMVARRLRELRDRPPRRTFLRDVFQPKPDRARLFLNGEALWRAQPERSGGGELIDQSHTEIRQLAQELGSQFSPRIEGTCIKHRFGSASIKMYDKFGIVLRIETPTNDVSLFKHHRKVEHRDGPPTRALAPVKKSI